MPPEYNFMNYALICCGNVYWHIGLLGNAKEIDKVLIALQKIDKTHVTGQNICLPQQEDFVIALGFNGCITSVFFIRNLSIVWG